MAQEYWKAEEPQEIAQRFMKFHPDLIGAHIAYLFKEKASNSDGRPVVGKVSKVPAKYAPLMDTNDDGTHGYEFIIEFGADVWMELSNATKDAWVDYLLEQCYGEETDAGEMKWKIRKPEVQAFPSILVRHGLNWDQGVNKLSVIELKHKPVAIDPTVRSEATEETVENVTVNS